MRVIEGDNLHVMQELIQAGEKFDLIELDGPYAANLEGWDILTDWEYLKHYQARLTLARQLLQPWGAVYMFGYPEYVALVHAWARESGTLHLRRWLTWYKQVTAHKGRKVETILLFIRGQADDTRAFGQFLKAQREARGWTLADVQAKADELGSPRPWWHRGGNLYFETGSGGPPAPRDLALLARIFDFDPEVWAHVTSGSYEGITDIDYISRTYLEETESLNDNGLRSKPVGLYLDLFRPCVPVTPGRALILYGGSGNAGIAAEALGFETSVIEYDPARVKAITKRAAKLTPKWTARAKARLVPLPFEGVQLSLI